VPGPELILPGLFIKNAPPLQRGYEIIIIGLYYYCVVGL